MQRVPPSAHTKEAIWQVVEERSDGDPKAALVKLGIQRVIEEALVLEATGGQFPRRFGKVPYLARIGDYMVRTARKRVSPSATRS